MKKFLNFLTILGVLLLIASAVIRNFEISQDEKYVLTTGTVTQMYVTSFGHPDEWHFCPKIEFTALEEQPVTYHPPCTSGYQNFKGQEVRIYYDPVNPGDAHIQGAQIKREWFEPKTSTVLMELGLFIMLAGIIQALVQKDTQ